MSKTTIKADTSKQGNVLDTVIDQEEEIIKENNGISQSPNKVKNGKIGYRRVAKNGQISYKHVPTTAIVKAMQLGIADSLLKSPLKQRSSVFFPTYGAYGRFYFKTFAPIVFQHFRRLSNIETSDFQESLCDQFAPPKELSNPGASGSIFYVSADDKFIIKTAESKEAKLLRKHLAEYMMHIYDNTPTLLPKFYGLYRYRTSSKCSLCCGTDIRLIIMNNLLPQTIQLQYKFDLKGSSMQRHASARELAKRNPTLKDLDFIREFKDGIILKNETYDSIIRMIGRDCELLKYFKIMDYSLFMAIHNIDQQADAEATSIYEENTCKGIIRGVNSRGERLLIFIGIIDVLQVYGRARELEHCLKSLCHDGDTISVINPARYAERFYDFMRHRVFRKQTEVDEIRTDVH